MRPNTIAAAGALPTFYALDFAGPGPYIGWVRRLIVLALVLLAAPSVGAGVQVRLSGDRVDVVAQNAPLSEILEALARETKTKLVYEGTPPRQLMFVDLKDRTPAEALLSILDGQGVAFAVAFDPSGTRVLTLLMSAATPSASAASTGPTPRPMPTPPERPMREPVVEEQPLEDGMTESDTGEAQLPPDTGRPNMLPPKSERPPTPGVLMPGAGAADYPTSTFAPKPPTPEPAKPPKSDATPPPFNP